jgi:Cu(I)/Ag(I) efflux system membrane fusion protein
MKKIIILCLASIVIGLGAGWLIFRDNGPATQDETTNGRKILFYRNPMNPSVTSKVPMKDNMGMDYVPVYSDDGSSGGERKIAYYRSPMNPEITSSVPKKDEMGMDYVPVYADNLETNTISIDPAVQQNMGVTTEPVKKRKLSRTIRTTANIAYNETKLYTVSTKIMGYIEKLFVDYTGQLVRKGQPLLEIYSPDLLSTQEEYLQALKYRDQISQTGSESSKEGAVMLVESAKRRLLNWDISEQDILSLEKRGTPQKTMTIYSPADGFVTDKMVINGQNIMPGMALYKIADLTTVWGLAQIYQYELPWIKTGDMADLQLSYMPGKTFKGKITYIYPFLDTDSKTVQVRIEIRNSNNYEFKPGMFADAVINSPIGVETITVPEQSVIRTGTRDIAIVALGNGYFKPVNVILGVHGDGGYVQVLKGLHEGDNIVTSSQFLIDSESNLNAAFNSMNQLEKTDTMNPAGDSIETKSENRSGAKTKADDNKKPVIIRSEPIDVKAIDKNHNGKVFQDIMDWNVISDEPGTCPICGMTLKEFTVSQAVENLKEHGLKVK